jgi:putative tryptophan/tyrosine transport system substrate-binding protein
MRQVGVLMGWPESARSVRPRASEIGLVRGRNLRIDTRWANPADPESMHRYAKELVALQPDLILSHSTPATAALLQETRTIPVIFGIVADPIGSGFVASFPRPGGNATGFAVAEPTQAGKWMELLKKIAPQVTRVAILFNPAMAPFLVSLTFLTSRARGLHQHAPTNGARS